MKCSVSVLPAVKASDKMRDEALLLTKPSSSEAPADSSSDNNNSYTTGRLKFFKEGRCLLELTHRNKVNAVGAGGGTWVPITKKVYWPPHASSEAPVKVECPEQTSGLENRTLVPAEWPRNGQLRKSRPVKLKTLNDPELSFAMKPPPCVVSLRKKIRGLARKTRRPYANIVVGTFLMRLESQTIKSRPKRRPFVNDRIRKSSRLEKVISKLPLRSKKVNFHIQSWGNQQQQRVSKPTLPVKIKSELCPVTETCTTLLSSPKFTTPSSVKIKAPTKNVLAENCVLSAKTLPITPTVARIKSESNSVIHSSSLMTPDMKRVKVEISGPRAFSPSSPDRNFMSPRKRLLKHEPSSSPNSKRHRLSTDSSGSRDGSNSPLCQMIASPPRPNNGRMSSFSIDSIINNCSKDDLKKPTIPASPGRVGEIRREYSSETDGLSHGSRTPTPASHHGSPAPRRSPTRSTPLVPISSFASRNFDQTMLDPRLAHLAGLAADPRLGLTPAGGANPYSFAYNYFAGSHFMQAAAVAAQTNNYPFDAGSLAGRLNWPPSSVAASSSVSSRSTPTSSSTSTSSTIWPGQYRGEPKVAPMEVQSQSPDTPLNLSMK